MVLTSARGLFLLTSTVASAVLLRRLTRRSAASAVNRVFIFGLGYTGKRIAMQLKRQGWEVYGTVRTQESADRLRAAAGINAFAFDRT
jgi:glutamyl-tRNA reductase